MNCLSNNSHSSKLCGVFGFNKTIPTEVLDVLTDYDFRPSEDRKKPLDDNRENLYDLISQLSKPNSALFKHLRSNDGTKFNLEGYCYRMRQGLTSIDQKLNYKEQALMFEDSAEEGIGVREWVDKGSKSGGLAEISDNYSMSLCSDARNLDFEAYLEDLEFWSEMFLKEGYNIKYIINESLEGNLDAVNTLSELVLEYSEFGVVLENVLEAREAGFWDFLDVKI